MSTGPFPQPHYPGFPPPHARPVGRSRSARPLVAAVLAVLTAAAIVVGTLLPSLRIRAFSGSTLEQTMTITAWGRTFDPQPTGAIGQFYANSHVALYGIPLSVIAAGLVAAAIAIMVSRRPGARVALIAAASAAVAAVFMLAMDVESSLSYEGAEGSTRQAFTSYDVGTGGWILGGAGLLALIAGLLAIGRGSRADDATPPQGFISPAASGYGRPVQAYPPPAQPYPPPGYGPPPRQDTPYKGTLPDEESTESRPPVWPPEPPGQRD
ncbi:hypothetical protein HFP15_09245 [Amycolatopsis sp. K13G38]|uniref:Uncharacterized protein n=1 Tax=Amycolatopsis acididurans TaxID=2724524 RepID=A0ABX1J0Z3_9PSEU|nr:hypothetical protein [Amycolatopsis acididurans]NKQ53066.1 hypothetical protein [Amycolatopsis acididurans]